MSRQVGESPHLACSGWGHFGQARAPNHTAEPGLSISFILSAATPQKVCILLKIDLIKPAAAFVSPEQGQRHPSSFDITLKQE